MVSGISPVYVSPGASPCTCIVSNIRQVTLSCFSVPRVPFDVVDMPCSGDRQKTAEFQKRLASGESMDDVLVEAFAVVREAAWRVLELRHYDVQVLPTQPQWNLTHTTTPLVSLTCHIPSVGYRFTSVVRSTVVVSIHDLVEMQSSACVGWLNVDHDQYIDPVRPASMEELLVRVEAHFSTFADFELPCFSLHYNEQGAQKGLSFLPLNPALKNM